MRRILAVFMMAFIGLAGTCLADPPAVFDMVEEDWQLVLTPPVSQDEGPQITTCMSPTSDFTTAPFAAFDMNYREYPDFVAGGMQVQVFSDKQILTTATQVGGQFNTPNESITWTQRMSVVNGQISYQVRNGRSASFGGFPSDVGNLAVSFATTAASLAGYDPAFSFKNSGVTWEKNYVTSLQLVQVRYFLNGTLLLTDSTVRSIDLSN
jgi:hypothetical protein